MKDEKDRRLDFPMTVLAMLDECLTTVRAISSLADKALADPSTQQAVILEVKRNCEDLQRSIAGFLYLVEEDEEISENLDLPRDLH